MAVSLSIISTDCVLGLNAGSGYSATVTDPRWTTQQVVDAVLNADGMVIAACIEDANNAYASGYYTTLSGLANGATISATLGPIVSVQFTLTGGLAPSVRPGILWDAGEIIHEIYYASNLTNPLNYEPRHQLQGRVIYHNGAAIAAVESATVSVSVVTINYTRSSACQAPDNFAWLVFAGAMAQLVNVEGEATGAATFWADIFYKGLEMIQNNKNMKPTGYEDFVRQSLAQAA